VQLKHTPEVARKVNCHLILVIVCIIINIIIITIITMIIIQSRQEQMPLGYDATATTAV